MKTNNDAPTLPMDNEERETPKESDDEMLDMDVQKELEAKFDELFGSFDDDED